MRFLFHKYQPKVSVLFAALLAVTFLLAGVMVWSARGGAGGKGFVAQKESTRVLHEDNIVRVESASLGQIESRTDTGVRAEEFFLISVKYPREKSISFVWEVPNIGVPTIVMANEKFVLIDIAGVPGNGVTDLYLIERATKKTQHLELKGKFLGMTNDAAKIVLRDGGKIIVKDVAALTELQSRTFANRETVVASGVSQDNTRVAFMTWNGQYEAPQKRNRVYVYDIQTNKVIDMGLAAEMAEKIIWTDENIFQSVIVSPVDNSAQVVELFEIKE